MYDAYISLGDTCEAGLQFQRIGYSESSFFRYIYSPYEVTLRLIETDFKDVFLKENLVPLNDKMVRDVKYNLYFHTHLLSKFDSQGRLQFSDEYNFDEVYQQEFNKIKYLINKWHNFVNSEKNILYFIRTEYSTSKSQAKSLFSLMRRKYPNHRFTIVYLQLNVCQEEDWKIPGLANRYLSKFAPLKNAYDADIEGWNQLFADFPLNVHANSSELTR